MLPKNYEQPVSKSSGDNYLNKFVEGDTRLRILSDIKTGYGWSIDANGKNTGSRQLVKGDKPVRVRTFKECASNPEGGDYKFFWVMIVWNYNAKKIQIWELKQAKIQKAIEAYEKDEDFGDSRGYDLMITRKGMGFENTSYQVIAKPPRPVDPNILDELDKTPIDLEAWFDSKNPFEGTTGQKNESTVIHSVPVKEDVEDDFDPGEETNVEDISDSIPF